MLPILRCACRLCPLALLAVIAACSNGTGSLDGPETPPQSSPPPPTSPPPSGGAQESRSVGGTVSGLTGSGLVLRNNGGDDLAITSNGSFTFATQLASGAQYRVVVATQPAEPAQICTVSAGSGAVGSTNVTNIGVTCATSTFSIGGAVNALLGSGLVLRNNGGDDLPITSDGPFTFATELASGATYDVRVRTLPSDPRQACTIQQGQGTVGATDVTNIAVNCNTSDFTVGGTVRDLAGTGLVLLNNGVDRLTINSSGDFTFGTALPSGATYAVTVASQPVNPAQTCTVSNGSGTVGSGNVSSVSVRCETVGFLVGGRVSRLRGEGLVLQNNGSDDLPIASSGRFTFSTPLTRGTPYNVTVARQPSNPRQNCTVRDGSGTISSSDVEDVEVRCRSDDDDD